MQGGKALIISNDILERRQYNGKFEKITWENCDLRGYLNNEFYNTTFTAAERTRIATTQVKNDDNQWYGTAGGNDTTDKIFLLSLEEAVKYFGDSGQLANRPGDTWWIDDQYNSARIAYRKNGKAEWFAVWWWLRSPGFDSGSAAIVDGDGSVGVRGYNVHVGDYYVYNDYASGGVRPALWLDLK
ncbi:MAG: DUF6273 domain-containing protein [Clostridiales bacterium]|nr:DUF6273 domain-containing protein [Clostridiales bacterium]